MTMCRERYSRWPIVSTSRLRDRMDEFIGADLRGARFERVDLSGAQLQAVDLSDARFRGVSLNGAVMRGVELGNVDIHGDVENLTINGVDIGPLVDAELNRWYPDRAKMRPTDPAGSARRGTSLSGSGAGPSNTPVACVLSCCTSEWSFIETLRHLVFASDS